MKRRINKVARLVMCLIGALLAQARESAQADTVTWNGGGGNDNWSTSDNWGGASLAGGDALVFGGTTRLTNSNDLAADTVFTGITFNNTAGAFSLSGSRIALGGNIVNNDAQTQHLNMDLALDATRTLGSVSGNFFLNGVLSGSGGLTKAGGDVSKIVVLTGDNTYDGATTVSTGILRIAHSRALGSAAGGTSVWGGNRLELSGGITVTGETVTVVGKGDNNGALQVQEGSNTWAGTILIGSGDARIGVVPASGALMVTGLIDDGPNTYPLIVRNADPGGPVILAGTNTYGGETQVVVGTLRLSGADNRLPTNTVIRLGNSSNVAYAMIDLSGCNQTVKGILADGSTMTRKITNNATQPATLTVGAVTPYTYGGTLEGNLSLLKRGSARLTLSAAANSHTGLTAVSEGELLLERPLCVQDSTVNTGTGPMGTLAFGTNTVMSFGGLMGANSLALTNSAGVPVSLRIRGAQNSVFDGQIVAGCDFTKASASVFTMTGANLYTGRTTLAGGILKVASEESLGAYPASYVDDQIIFDGGILKADTNFVLSASNRGVKLAAGGGTLMTGGLSNLFTLGKQLAGPGAFATRGLGVVLVTQSNAYDGVTTVYEGVLRVTDKSGLGSAASGTVVSVNSELELGDGVVVSGEAVTVNGAGITFEPPPPSSPASNRGALQAAAGATAEWAGPVLLGSSQARFGAQNNAHLIVSGVIDDGAATYSIRTSTNPNDRQRGVEFRAHNTYGGSTDLTRGTLFLGVSDALPVTTSLDVHWASSNNGEYSGLDMRGFNQTVGALMNSGQSGSDATITNSSASLSTLTVNQASDTAYKGTICGPIALVKEGVGTLALGYPTRYSGPTTVRAGTLTLDTNQALSSGSEVVLDGGTLDASATTNTLASLTVTAASSLTLGAGQLVFSAQTTNAWAGTLSLTGTLGPATLRTLPLLTPSQLGSIRFNGGLVAQSADGYLTPYFGTLIRLH